MPGAKQAWPNSAACWSPAMPETGMPAGMPAAVRRSRRSARSTAAPPAARRGGAGDNAYVQRRDIVDRMIEELSKHAAVEEQLFYPVARETVPGDEDIALESLEEHHIVKWVLAELDDVDPQRRALRRQGHRPDRRRAPPRQGGRAVQLLPKVRAQCEPDRSRRPRLRLGRRPEEVSLPTRPHPRLPDAGPGTAVVGRDRRSGRPRRRQRRRIRTRQRERTPRPHRTHHSGSASSATTPTPLFSSCCPQVSGE